MAQHFSTNQNAIGGHHSENENILLSDQKENQQILNTSSPSTHFTTDNPVELRIDSNNKLKKIDSQSSQKSVTITRRSSKPSRHKSVQIPTSQTRKHQRDRYINYHDRLEENQLYSLTVSSDNIECYGTNCQPSIFNASYRCRTISPDNDIDRIEKLPLMNDQHIKQNISYISLTNLSNIMDHEPNVSRTDSYIRSTSNILMHKPSLFLANIFNKMTHEQRATSIAQLTKLHESLSKSNTTIDNLQRTTSLPDLNKKPTKLHSVTSVVPERVTPNIIQMENKTSSTSSIEQERANLEKSSDESTTDLNEETTSAFIDQKIHTPAHISSPIKLVSHPSLDPSSEQKSSQENMQTVDTNNSPVTKQSSKTVHTSDIEQTNTEFPDLTNSIEVKPNAPSSNSQSRDLLPLNDESEIENSLNDITDYLSQQNTAISNINPDKLRNIPSKDFNKTKRILPSLKKIDEVSQHSESSVSHIKKATLLTASPAISIGKKTLSTTPISLIDDGDTSMITRTTTASTNLNITDDDDEQSKLINEQLKRNSLGLARDSLELLRNATPHHASSTEQLTPHTNTDGTPRKRKSVLKSRFESSDNLPTPELISYIAIDEVKGDIRSMEKQMRRRSLTVGGGIIISCTSPKPKRDSLILLQERYSGSMTPHSGYNHLSNSDSRHVEFIREPGDSVTPVLHIGRGTKSKRPLNKPMSPFSSNEQFHPHGSSNHTFDSTERSKSEISIMDNQQQFKTQIPPRRPSLDSATRHRTPQTPLPSTTTSFIDTDDIEDEKICLNKSDYDEMVRLIMTPLSKNKKKYPAKSTFKSNIKLCTNNRLTTFLNLIILILLISFYIFIFIKSQYWQEHLQK